MPGEVEHAASLFRVEHAASLFMPRERSATVKTSELDAFRFLVLNKKSTWDEGLSLNLQTSDEGIRLEERVQYTTERTIERDELPKDFEVKDFALGRCNLLYMLDATSRSVWIYDPEQARLEPIECIDALFSNPTSITSIPGTLYVADDQAEARIFAFAEINWQIRWTVSASEDATGQTIDLENPFTPMDLAVDVGGSLYALDKSNLVIVKFDSAGRLVTVFGGDVLNAPVAIAVSRDGFLYVLDLAEADPKVLKFSTEGEVVASEFIRFQPLIEDQKLPPEFKPSGLAVDTKGNLVIGDGRTIDEGEEDDRFIHRFSPSGDYIGSILEYRGAVDKLVVDNADRIYIFNQEEGQITILKPEPTFLKPGVAPPPIGRYFSKALDSTELGTQWHKLALDTKVPENTQIQVSYFIADQEKTQAEIQTLDDSEWSEPLVNPKDALIRSPTGRYLWLRIELIGSEQQTPTVKSVRAYFPRRSYLRYLPAVYQEDDRSRDFLERFLSLFETLFGNLEWQIDHVVRYFDPDVVKGDFLRWLASWLAIAVDENWTEEQQRVLIKKAPELYKKRGTREGIEEMIEIFTDQRPFIVERFQLECAQAAEIKQILNKLYGDDPYCFCVLLNLLQVNTENGCRTVRRMTENERRTVRRIVDSEKPAHTCAGLQVLQPWIYLDMHTYLGVNTYLSEPSPRLDVGSAIPRDTVLTDLPEAGQIERRSRLGLDTTLT